MSDVHTIAARSASSVKEKGLTFLISIEDEVQFAVTKHNASAHEPVRTMPGNLMKSFEQFLADKVRAEFSDQLVIVYRQQLARLVDAPRDIEGSNYLLDSLGLMILLRETQGRE